MSVELLDENDLLLRQLQSRQGETSVDAARLAKDGCTDVRVDVA